MKQIFIDLETTGLDCKKDVITEISCIYKKNGKIVSRFTQTTRKNLEKNFVDYLDSIISKYDAKDKAYFLAYNARFDSDFMHAFFREIPGSNFGNYFYHTPIDILGLASYKFMLNGTIPSSFKLMDVARELGIKVNENKLPKAEYDINITNEVYKKLRKL